jgi:hypothetical protein
MLGKELYIIDTFPSYESRDEVRIKTCLELKDSSKSIVKNELH